jgi:hypothetical protein
VVYAGLNAFSGECFLTQELVSADIAVVLKSYLVKDKLNLVIYIAYNSNRTQAEVIYYL